MDSRWSLSADLAGGDDNIMYKEALKMSGLSPKEAEIYEVLLQMGEGKASEIYKKTPYKRSLVYNLLDELVQKGLVLKLEKPGKVAVFRLDHPQKMGELVEAEEKKIRYFKRSLDELMPQLVSSYNLAFNKPGVRFFEGVEGAKKVAEDSLTAKTEIYSYVDNQAVNKLIPEINEGYLKKRKERGIIKKIITLDSEYIRKRVKKFDPKITKTRVIKGGYDFSVVMQIYDNKVSYITLGEDREKIVGIIIEDKFISKMHKTLFEYAWNKAENVMGDSETQKKEIEDKKDLLFSDKTKLAQKEETKNSSKDEGLDEDGFERNDTYWS